MMSPPIQGSYQLRENTSLADLFFINGEVQVEMQKAIAMSKYAPFDSSAMLKTNFHSNIWPKLKPKYEQFVDKLLRYCKEELKTQNFNCIVIGRAKAAESVKKALDRREKHRGYSYTSLADVFNTMHDLAGITIIMNYPNDVQKVNDFILQSFHAIQPPTYWSRDRQPGLLWDSQFGSYESYNHHIAIQKPLGLPTIIFEIQVTTLENHLYNSLAHDWYYKKDHGPMSRKDEMVMDMLHGAAIIFQTGVEYMKEREDENRGKAGNEYDLLQGVLLTNGTERWQLQPENLSSVLPALRENGYDSDIKLKHLAREFLHLKKEDRLGSNPLTQLLETTPQKSRRISSALTRTAEPLDQKETYQPEAAVYDALQLFIHTLPSLGPLMLKQKFQSLLRWASSEGGHALISMEMGHGIARLVYLARVVCIGQDFCRELMKGGVLETLSAQLLQGLTGFEVSCHLFHVWGADDGQKHWETFYDWILLEPNNTWVFFSLLGLRALSKEGVANSNREFIEQNTGDLAILLVEIGACVLLEEVIDYEKTGRPPECENLKEPRRLSGVAKEWTEKKMKIIEQYRRYCHVIMYRRR